VPIPESLEPGLAGAPAAGTPLDFVRAVFPLGRVVPTLACSACVALFLGFGWTSPLPGLWARVVGIGLALLLVFGILERWPRRLPRGVARWALQVVGVGLAVPVFTTIVYLVTTPAGGPPFWEVETRLNGFGVLTFGGVLVAPWVALSALVRQREARVSELSLAVELQRSELERRALEARMNLLTAQIKPHFLFNTLANVHALVETDSPRASQVLESLIAYLRAALPRLSGGGGTLGEELELCRAYLDLMQLRMPDRLRVEWRVAPGLGSLRCPPLSVLTLIENAVRHGIDPSERGGTVSIGIEVGDGACRIQVVDDGAGLAQPPQGPGTGLAALRERLQLAFGPSIRVSLNSGATGGAIAEASFPALRSDS
jgi:signal transduction histidine kinase